MTVAMPRIDAHHHVWDLAVRPQTWLDPPEMAPIRQTFTIDDLRPEAAAVGVDATVLVQTVPSEDETLGFLAIAAAESLVAAVTGWVDLTAPDVGDRIATLLEAPGGSYLRAIRHGVQDEPDPGWLLRTDVRRGIGAVGAADLAFELLVKPVQLAAAVDVARALPEVRFVLDHCGKPAIARHVVDPDPQAFDTWREAIRDLAQARNVVCKVSGLVTEADWTNWTPADLWPYLEGVLEAFGAERAMFGSDWPVCLLASSYQRWAAVVSGLNDYLSDSELRLLWAGTAGKTYGIDVPQAPPPV